MVSRLVLGWGSTGQAIITAAGDWRGPVHVITDNPELIETLRDDNIPATRADPQSPSTLNAFESPVDVVLIASDDPERNCAITAAARAAFPEADIVAYTGKKPTERERAVLLTLADRVIDYVDVLAGAVLEASADPAAIRAHRLRTVLRNVEGTLGVFMHDNPDPDALASAVGLVHIAEAMGVEAQACYFGEITHQENMAFVNLLELDLTQLDPSDDVPDFDEFALVDHSIPGINNQLSENTPVTIILDHHTPSGPVDGEFVDLRETVGATSSIVIEYLHWFDIRNDEALATALLYGIRTDTRDFSRKITILDFESAESVLERADTAVIERIENPSISRGTLRTIARAIENRTVRGSILASCVGQIRDRDVLGQAADLLLQLEGITATIVYGFSDETVYASARTSGTRGTIDVGEVMRDAFGQIGNAGGHTEMAAAQIPLGFLGAVDPDSEDRLIDVISEVIDNRFFQTVEDHTPYVATVNADFSRGPDDRWPRTRPR